MSDLQTTPVHAREQLIIMAAYFHGTGPDGMYTANCGRVLAQAIVWAGEWSDELRERGEFQAGLDGLEGPSIVDEWYDTLMAMIQVEPRSQLLLEGWGNFGSPAGDPPAAPSFTACGLTSKGRTLAEQLLKEHPQFVSKPREFFCGL